MHVDRKTPVMKGGIVLAVFAVLATLAAVYCAPECPAHNEERASRVPAGRAIPAALSFAPSAGATDVDPLGTVAVTAIEGKLTAVSMTNEEDGRVAGVMTPDDKVWKSAVPLGYGRTYTLTATGVGTDGTSTTRTSTFSTLVPSNQSKVALTTTGGAPLQYGGTYGIGTVVVAHFDEPIADRAAAERQLIISTSPAIHGSWYWPTSRMRTGGPNTITAPAPGSPSRRPSMAAP